MSAINLVAQLSAKPGQEAALEAAMLAMLKPTRIEVGCQRYDFFASNRKGRYFMIELWESQEALDAHMKSPHFQVLVATLPGLLDGKLELDLLQGIDV